MSRKILIIDDEPDLLRVAAFRLRSCGYEVLSALDGQQGLDMLMEHSPDLILLDLNLPVVDGSDVCRQIKSSPKLKKIPVLIFTAGADTPTAKVTEELGANDYVTKPFSPEDLFEKIEGLLGEKQNV